jgi:hypothetical protein
VAVSPLIPGSVSVTSNSTVLGSSTPIVSPSYPKTVELEVTETEPGIKGDTATGATKSATVETGYTIGFELPC